MGKSIILSSVSNDTINTLSAYAQNMHTSEKKRLEARQKIKELENTREAIIAEMNKALENGVAFDDAKNKFSTLKVDNEIRAIQNALTEELKPYREARKKLLKDLCVETLYDAYVVGVRKGDFSANGTVTLTKQKKDGGTRSKDYTCTHSFNTQVAEWLGGLGLMNADNEGAVRRFSKNYLTPFIGTKTDKLNIDLVAKNKNDFADTLLISFKKVLVKGNVVVEDTTTHALTRIEK